MIIHMTLSPSLRRILSIICNLTNDNIDYDVNSIDIYRQASDQPEYEVGLHLYELSSRGYIVEVLPRPATVGFKLLQITRLGATECGI
jgi:hypothetical protein